MAKSKLKPALYYAFRNGWYKGLGYRPVAVTSTNTRHWHGRECGENTPVHGRLSDLKGRFPSEEAAMAALDGLRAIDAKYKPLLEENRKASNSLHQAQGNEEKEFLKAQSANGQP